LKHPEKVLGVTLISNDQTPEVLQPGKQPLDLPHSSMSLQPTIRSELCLKTLFRAGDFGE